MTSKTLIRVGHSAYTGSNKYRLCFSKAQAVRVLRNRGVKRDDARKAVQEALINRGAAVRGECMGNVEIVDESYGLKAGYYMNSYKDLRAHWSSISEL
jgi:hypothetical protein